MTSVPVSSSSGARVAFGSILCTSAAGVDGEAIRDVRVLERFSFLAVPESELETVLERVNGVRAGDAVLRVEAVES